MSRGEPVIETLFAGQGEAAKSLYHDKPVESGAASSVGEAIAAPTREL